MRHGKKAGKLCAAPHIEHGAVQVLTAGPDLQGRPESQKTFQPGNLNMDFTKEEILRRARFIFNNGRLVHERLLKSQMEYLAGNRQAAAFSDLSPAQHRCLLAVRRRGEITITELAEYLGVSPPSASAMVDRLVEKGVLVRRQSTKDRRKVIVALTDEAARVVDGVEKHLLGAFVELVEMVGPETSAKWCEVLERIGSFLDPGSSGRGKADATGRRKKT